jgi:hypothetical protein
MDSENNVPYYLGLPHLARVLSGRYRNFRMECIKILNFERKIRVLYFRKTISIFIKVTYKKNIFNLLQMYLDGHTFQKILLFSIVLFPL